MNRDLCNMSKTKKNITAFYCKIDIAFFVPVLYTEYVLKMTRESDRNIGLPFAFVPILDAHPRVSPQDFPLGLHKLPT